MDDTATISSLTDSDAGDKIELPKESRVSYFLNGIGNGAMIGSIPALSRVMQPENGFLNSPKGKTATLVFAVSCATIGGLYGILEGRRIHEYRQAVKDEMQHQREQIRELTQQQRALHAKLQAKEPSPTR